MKQQGKSIVALVLVLAAGAAAAQAGGRQGADGPDKPASGQGAVQRCLPEDAGGLAAGQPDYADTRRELTQRARHGATAAERKHAAMMLARITADETATRKESGDGRQEKRQPAPGLCQ